MKIDTKTSSRLLSAALAIGAFFAGMSLTTSDKTGAPIQAVTQRAGQCADIATSTATGRTVRTSTAQRGRPVRWRSAGAPIDEQLAFLELLADLTPGRVEEALERLSAHAPHSLAWRYNSRLLFQAWARENPEAALARAAEFEPDSRSSVLSGALCGLAEIDPQAARSWLESNPPNPVLAAAVVEGMARHDPAEATRFVTGLAADAHRGILIDTIATEQARRGLPEATAWAQTLEDPEFRDAALGNLARHLVATEGPGAGVRWIAEQAALAPAGEFTGAIEVVAELWAGEDAGAAAQWLHSLPDGAGSDMLPRVVGRWTAEDPGETGEFLNQLDDSPLRCRAVCQFAQRLSPEYPEQACEWAATISDARLRDLAVTNALRAWNRQDPAAAAQWSAQQGG